MPWKATPVVEAKVQFNSDCLSGEEPMTVLCEMPQRAVRVPLEPIAKLA